MKYAALITLLLLGLVQGCQKSISPGLANLSPYREDSPYSDVLNECATATTSSGSCSLETLPPIGMDQSQVTRDMVMDRVLVSHAWMGLRFQQLLEALPDDLIQLFGSVTAVTIGADIRPSYYWSLTGGMYLDPASLWLLADEKDVISRNPDYRGAFADPMNFRSHWRYTIGNEPAFRHYGLESPEDRTIDDIVIPMASLLFHELAHANDFLPQSEMANLNPKQSIARAISSVTKTSDVLSSMFSLTSTEWFQLAGVLYRGVTPTDADLARTAEEVGGFFEPDDASDDYSYTTQYEDLAMIFEEAMMKKHFNVDRNMGFSTNPESGSPCSDYVVGWGVRNRIGDADVKARAAWVTSQLLPNSDYNEFFATLPAPQSLQLGVGWCDALIITPANAAFDRGPTPHTLHPEQLLKPYLPVEPHFE